LRLSLSLSLSFGSSGCVDPGRLSRVMIDGLIRIGIRGRVWVRVRVHNWW
jgi:hypothetical protein